MGGSVTVQVQYLVHSLQNLGTHGRVLGQETGALVSILELNEHAQKWDGQATYIISMVSKPRSCETEFNRACQVIIVPA